MCEHAAMQLMDGEECGCSFKKNHSVSTVTDVINDLVIVLAPEGGVESATAVIRWLKSGCYHKLLSVLLNSSSEL